MKRSNLLSLVTVLAFLVACSASATTFVVRSDRALVERADAIVVASALTSYPQLTPQGGIETVTSFSIEEVIKGTLNTQTINVAEPGGVVGSRATIIPGSPRFSPGRRMLVFLMKSGPDRWSVLDLVVGKFTFADDALGQKILVRDEGDINGYDPDLTPHRETRRAGNKFLDFVRSEAQGKHPVMDYHVPAAPLLDEMTVVSPSKVVKASSISGNAVALAAGFSATSYTMTISGSLGARWTSFPNPVTFYMGSTQEAGAPGGGATAVQTALAAWTNDSGSNVNYVYGGVDSTHTQGLHAPDGRNTVLYERDLSSWGVPPFTCSGNSYGGTLGIGGVTSASGQNTLGSETFATITEADVEMNRGIANCTLLFNNGDFNTGVTHEVGHTLGFRHSDQDRASSGPCTNDPSLECSNAAVMKATVPPGLNAALQPWDVNAVRAVYPGSTQACTVPTVSASASPSSITSGQSATLTSSTTGSPTSYQWYNGQSGNTASPIGGGTGPALSVGPASTTSYWLRVANACGSANSNTVTLTVTAAPPPPPPPPPPPARRYTPGDYNGDGKADPTVFRPSNGNWYIFGVGTILWGQAGDIPVPADYDGDKITDIVVFRPSNSMWYYRLSRAPGGGVQWGQSGDVPAPADYDGDGLADICVFRPSNGTWYVRWSTGSGPNVVLGTAGDIPVPADYDGTGRAQFAVFHPANGNFTIRHANGTTTSTLWGQNGDIPVPADYNGDGVAEMAVFRPANGYFYVPLPNVSALWGQNGDQPVPADYGGNGAAVLAVFRPSTGYFYIRLPNASVQWGQNGDIAPRAK
jgi:hypothetical protein